MVGVTRDRLRLESGVFFYFRDRAGARAAYHRLRDLAASRPLPCRTQLLLLALPDGARLPLAVGMAYPAECDPDISAWLLEHGGAVGEFADGGIGRLEILRRDARTLESDQLAARAERQSRPRAEVFAGVDRGVQRIA